MRILRWWWRRPARTPMILRLTLAALLGAVALIGIVGPADGQQSASSPSARLTKQAYNPAPGADVKRFPQTTKLVNEGRQLFRNGCASCHGLTLGGRAGIAPSLRGVGAGPIDFYLSTGRMPLQAPHDEPVETKPLYTGQRLKALVAYITKTGGGDPDAPAVNIKAGSLDLGQQIFTEDCAGCHQMLGRGGLTYEAFVPNLLSAKPYQVAEAVRMGPYVMPHFDSDQINQHQLNSLARYVEWTHEPTNRGGWGIYNIGPIPEGIAAWFIALLALVIVARIIGERTQGSNL